MVEPELRAATEASGTQTEAEVPGCSIKTPVVLEGPELRAEGHVPEDEPTLLNTPEEASEETPS